MSRLFTFRVKSMFKNIKRWFAARFKIRSTPEQNETPLILDTPVIDPTPKPKPDITITSSISTSAITEDHKTIANDVLELFETGSLQNGPEAYGRVTLLVGDTGRLTYGRHQATLTSGSLIEILKNYIYYDGILSNEISAYMEGVRKRIPSIDTDSQFHLLLRRAGSDPVMVEVQDKFFRRAYSEPALKWFHKMGCEYPLSYLIIYDSVIHGSWYNPQWGGIKDRTDRKHGTIFKIGEKVWMVRYLKERRDWLKNHSIKILRNTVYRQNNLLRLAEEGNWTLETPFKVLSQEIVLKPKKVFNNLDRTIRLRRPTMIGEDIYQLELALNKTGFLTTREVTGEFDKIDRAALMKFQTQNGLSVDGIAGPNTKSVLSSQIQKKIFV